MSETPKNLKYLKSHEWARDDGAVITVGITAHAASLLGDLVFVQLPEKGKKIKISEEVAVVESVKSASDVYSPVSGEVVEINEAVATDPAILNQDAFGKGWLYKITPIDKSELNSLLSAEEYSAQIGEEN